MPNPLFPQTPAHPLPAGPRVELPLPRPPRTIHEEWSRLVAPSRRRPRLRTAAPQPPSWQDCGR